MFLRSILCMFWTTVSTSKPFVQTSLDHKAHMQLEVSEDPLNQFGTNVLSGF